MLLFHSRFIAVSFVNKIIRYALMVQLILTLKFDCSLSVFSVLLTPSRFFCKGALGENPVSLLLVKMVNMVIVAIIIRVWSELNVALLY